MGMFLNYQNLAENYMPNNLVKAFPQHQIDTKLDPLEASKPYEDYNTKGELTGYFWRYGETLNLEFNIDGEITVEPEAIVYTTTGIVPTEWTMGRVGQTAYNVVDLRSWKCYGIVDKKYYWQEDDEFTYPLNTDRSIYVSAEDYLKGKFVEVTLYNFRREPVCKKVYPATQRVIFAIDKELSARLPRSVYYCSVVVFNNEMSVTIFDQNDCQLVVK